MEQFTDLKVHVDGTQKYVISKQLRREKKLAVLDSGTSHQKKVPCSKAYFQALIINPNDIKNHNDLA